MSSAKLVAANPNAFVELGALLGVRYTSNANALEDDHPYMKWLIPSNGGAGRMTFMFGRERLKFNATASYAQDDGDDGAASALLKLVRLREGLFQWLAPGLRKGIAPPTLGSIDWSTGIGVRQVRWRQQTVGYRAHLFGKDRPSLPLRKIAEFPDAESALQAAAEDFAQASAAAYGCSQWRQLGDAFELPESLSELHVFSISPEDEVVRSGRSIVRRRRDA